MCDNFLLSIQSYTKQNLSSFSPTSIFGYVKNSKKKSNATLGAVSETGYVYLWHHSVSCDPSSKPIAPVSKLTVKGSAKSPSIFLAAFESESSDETLLLARGSLHKPQFQKISYKDDKGNFIKEIELDALEESSLLLEKSNKKVNKL